MPSSNSVVLKPARALPADVLAALERAVDRLGSQVAVAEQLGISPSAVNQALKSKYRGDVDGIAQRIRGVLMSLSWHCPVLGDISAKACLDEQRRPLVFSNPLRVRLHRACKTCPHRKEAQPKGETHAT